MKNLNKIIELLRIHKPGLEEKFGLQTMAVFGSYARQQQTEESDINILVDFKKPVGIEFIDLAEELESILKMRVDLVSKKGVKDRYLKTIENELLYV